MTDKGIRKGIESGIQTVLFDLDGTIIDTNELIIQSFIHALDGTIPQPPTRDRIISIMGRPLVEQLQLLSGREDVTELEQRYREFNIENHDRLARPFPYAAEVIRRLHAQGVRMGIVTTKIRRTTGMGLRLLGIENLMEAVVTVEDVELPKPDPQPVVKALEIMGSDPRTALMVGDSHYDIMAANRAGVISAGVSWSLKGADFLRRYDPRHILHDIRELFDITGIAGDPD
ncbi:pyrophosphatase PpaX [Ferviditalea candida]|uniref:Pyrophosphatase PpaX n=1 Tax=Ferviditalea candida TaxID=3108399 RepID=A0ABU5ZNF5_9BACL|nr:pyrophosphatase PpaX [Paenibacillaceae bacterium T2]